MFFKKMSLSKQLNFAKPATRPQTRSNLADKTATTPNPSIVNGPEPRSRQSSIVNHLLALALYLALTLLFAWPVLLNLTQGTPGHFPVDRNQNLWNFWWFRRSLLETFSNPYQSNFLFYPFGVNLYLHTFSPYNLLAGLPLQLIFGLIPGYGLLELSTFILAPYGGYLLTRYLTKNEGAALVGGAVYGFCAYHFVELLMDQMNLVSLQWLPFFVLFLLKTDRATTRRDLLSNGALAAFFFLLSMMVDFYYAVYLVMFAGLWWLWRCGPVIWQALRQKTEKAKALRHVLWLTVRMAAIFGAAALVFSPVLYGTVKAVLSGRYQSLENSGNHQVHSADLVNMWLPPAYHPFWGVASGLWNGIKLNPAGAVPGYVALSLSIYALLKIRGLWFWGATALFWLVISLGPTLWLNGTETGIALPYRLLAQLPLFNITRAPERFIVMVMLSLAVLSAYAVVRLSEKFSGRGRWTVAGLALGLIYLEMTPGFLPLPDQIGPFPFAEAIKATNGKVAPDKAILELPVTKHQNYDSPRMLYQIYHQRPIIGGYISRKLRDPYRENDYALFDFIELRGIDPDIVPTKTPQEWRGLLNYANMGYVVVYPTDPVIGNSLPRLQNLVNRALENPTPIYQDDFARVYQVGPGKLDKPVLVLTEGWNDLEKVDANRVQRWIREPEDPGVNPEARANIVVGPEVKLQDSYTLELEAASFARARRLQVYLNGALVQEINVGGLEKFTLSGLKLKPGDNSLVLRPDPADGYSVPSQVDPNSKDTRKLRIAVTSMIVR
jgi:hypothetical protein